MPVIPLLTDVAIPISMACRLYGNLLAGMIVMDLIYGAMKYFAVAIPAALSLYFNFFDSAIQAYIFVTLTLSYVSEAIE